MNLSGGRLLYIFLVPGGLPDGWLAGLATAITLARDDSAWLNQQLLADGFRVSAVIPRQKTLKEFFLLITQAGGQTHA